jgi:hypothetical protein
VRNVAATTQQRICFSMAVAATDHFAADSGVVPEASDENRSMMS